MTVVAEAPAKPGETLVSAKGESPWAGMGITLDDDGMRSEKALKLAKLDFDVVKSPARTILNGKHVKGEDMFLTVRTDTNTALGMVGERYMPYQNREAFLFGDDIVDSSEAHWVRAGSKNGGRTVWMLMELPNAITVEGFDDDTIKPFLLISNGHDGGSSLTASLTLLRMLCNNALTPALKGAIRQIRIRHTKKMSGRIHEAKRVLGLSHQYIEVFQKNADKMVAAKFSDKAFDKFLEEISPTEDKEKAALTRAQDRQEEIKAIWKNAPDLQNIRKTRWGAYNAIVDYHDHYIDGRGDNKDEKRFSRIMTNTNLTHKAHKILLPA